MKNKFTVVYLIAGSIVLIMGLFSFYDSTRTDTFETFLISFGVGLFFSIASIILIYAGVTGKDTAKTPPHKILAKKSEDKPGILEIVVGGVILILSLILFIDGYGRYTNPLYPLFSESVKSEISAFLLFGLAGTVFSFILIVFGFIKYSKEDRRG